MDVLITGGAGFIGSNLARLLVGHPGVGRVRVVDDLSTGSKENLADLDVDLYEGDVLDARLLDETFREVGAVIHLAARPSVPRSVKDPLASHQANVTGTLQVLEAARRAGNPHLIAVSSSSVYGMNPQLPKHEDLPSAPLSPYAATKVATEAYLAAYQYTYRLPALVFRLFNVYGPGQAAGHAYAAVIPTWISAALAGHPVIVHGDGTQTRDFTYVGTVSRVLCDAVANRVVHSRPVNLALGTRTSLLGLLESLETATGLSAEVRYVPSRPGDVPHSQADSTLLRSLFPTVRPLVLEDGLAATVAWFRDRMRKC